MPNTVTGRRTTLALAVWAAAAALSAALVYAPSLNGEFVLDDWALIVNDSLVHDISNIPRAFFTDFLRGSLGPEIPYYRPLVTVSFQLNYWMSGPNPAAFRAANLLLHAAASLLVLYLAMRVTGSTAAAGAAAIVFAVHPAHAEPVAWISGRTDVMSTLFCLASFLVLFPRKALSWPRAAAGSVLFLGGILSKEIALALPLIAAGYVLVFNCQGARSRAVKWLAAFALPVLAYVILRSHATEVPMAGHLTLRLTERLLGVGIAYASYLRMMFVPMPANVIYDVFPIGIKYPWVAAAAWGLPVLLAAGGIALRKRHPAAAFSLLWILLSLLPVTNLIPTLGPLPAERFCYLASVGASLLIGYLGSLAWVRLQRAGRLYAVVFLIAACGFALYCGATTIEGSQKYKSNVSWARAIAAGNGRFLRSAAGQYLAEAGFLEEAVSEFEAAIRINPDDPANYVALLKILRALGRDREAEDLQAVIKARFQPEKPHVRRRLNRL